MSTRSLRTFRVLPVAGFITSLAGTAAITSACSSDNNNAGGRDGGTGGSSADGSMNTGGKSSGGSTNSGGSGATCSSPGAPATEPVDDHCAGDSGPIVQETGKCITGVVDAGATADGGAVEEMLPGPWGGTSSADDDCKYDVSYTHTAICESSDVTFTVTLKSRVDHSAVTGAGPSMEVLDPNGIPAAEGSQSATETSKGVYEIKPIRFTKKGKWTVRFHFFEQCSDALEDSPHGHTAFFINVP